MVIPTYVLIILCTLGIAAVATYLIVIAEVLASCNCTEGLRAGGVMFLCSLYGVIGLLTHALLSLCGV